MRSSEKHNPTLCKYISIGYNLKRIIASGMRNQRNQLVFDSKLVHPSEALRQAPSLQTDYKVAKEKNTVPSLSKRVWSASNPGELKLNVDGAIFSEQYRAEAGHVLRDDYGRVVVADTNLRSTRETLWRWNN